MNHRYAQRFDEARKRGRSALIPFAVIGLNGDESFIRWIDMLIDNGADALELGIPFSDPVADGPVIQKASAQALAQGITIRRAFSLIDKVRARHPSIPIGLLVYANLVVAGGIDAFYQNAQKSGVDSVLIADVPVHMGKAFEAAAQKFGISPIYIATSDCDSERLSAIGHHSNAFVYMVSRPGVTGTDLRPALSRFDFTRIRRHIDVPIVIGFGIDGPEAARQAAEMGFDGVVVGTALVKHQLADDVVECQTLMQALAQAVVRSQRD